MSSPTTNRNTGGNKQKDLKEKKRKELEEQERLKKLEKEKEEKALLEAATTRKELSEPKNSDDGSSEKSSDAEEPASSIDKPLIVRPYNSTTIAATLASLVPPPTSTQPLKKMLYIKKRKDFAHSYKFSDSDSSDHYTEIKPQMDPLYHQPKKIIEIGLQGCNELTFISTQTVWNRKVTRAEQVIFEENEVEVEDENGDLINFLQNVYPLMEEALQSNETIDVFQDDFDIVKEEDNLNQGKELTNMIKEVKSFSNLQCEGKKISCVQFHPSQNNPKGKFIVAESFIENISFDDRAILSVKSYKSMIMFWDFEDIHSIEPILILSSPLEILCFDFNPKDPNIIVAGAINGQVILWDLKGATSTTNLTLKKTQKAKQERNTVPIINPLILSALQDPSGAAQQGSSEMIKKNVNSHKNPILSLKWLPNGVDIDRKHFYNFAHNNAGDCNQFLTISEDGQVLVWDIRFGEKDPRKNAEFANSISWKAVYGIQLFRPEGGGKMGGSNIAFHRGQKSPSFAGTSDEGELFVVDWSAKNSEEGNKTDMVSRLWNYERSYRPVCALERSPFYEDIILTIHDFHFSIWRVDVEVPIFSSCIIKNAQFVCGGFSLYRPGIVVIGRNDGWIDIWDFLDQSHKWTLQYNVVTFGISYIRFHEAMQNIIGIGDDNGTLHILELPYTLWKKIGSEELTMREFWDREVSRVEYFKKRFTKREEMAEAEKVAKEKEMAKKEKEKEKESEKKEDDDELMEREYQKFCDEYIKNNIEKTLDKKGNADKKNEKDLNKK